MSAGWRQGLRDFLLRGAPLLQRHARLDDLRRGYRRAPSFSQLLPWLELLGDDSVLLDDGHSVAAVLSLSPVAVEGHAADFLQELRDGLTRVLVEAFLSTSAPRGCCSSTPSKMPVVSIAVGGSCQRVGPSGPMAVTAIISSAFLVSTWPI